MTTDRLGWVASHASGTTGRGRVTHVQGVGPGSVLGGRYAVTLRTSEGVHHERWRANDHTLEREVVLVCFSGRSVGRAAGARRRPACRRHRGLPPRAGARRGHRPGRRFHRRGAADGGRSSLAPAPERGPRRRRGAPPDRRGRDGPRQGEPPRSAPPRPDAQRAPAHARRRREGPRTGHRGRADRRRPAVRRARVSRRRRRPRQDRVCRPHRSLADGGRRRRADPRRRVGRSGSRTDHRRRGGRALRDRRGCAQRPRPHLPHDARQRPPRPDLPR